MWYVQYREKCLYLLIIFKNENKIYYHKIINVAYKSILKYCCINKEFNNVLFILK